MWAPSVYLSARTASVLALRLQGLVSSLASESQCAGWDGGLGKEWQEGAPSLGLASWTFHSPVPLSLRVAKRLDRQAKKEPHPGLSLLALTPRLGSTCLVLPGLGDPEGRAVSELPLSPHVTAFNL